MWQILSKKNLQPLKLGYIIATATIAVILSPIIVCSITDRFLQLKNVINTLSSGAVLMYLAVQQTTFNTFFPILLLYSLIYMHTIALTNSITFSYEDDIVKPYPVI